MRWAEWARSGVPIVEPVSGRPGALRVTFLWRPERRVTRPSLYAPILDLMNGEGALTALGTSGVWYRSVELPPTARTLYAFSPLPTPGSTPRAPSWPEYFRSLRPDPFQSERLTFAADPDDPEDREATVSVLSLSRASGPVSSPPADTVYWTESETRLRSAHLPGTRRVWVYRPPEFDPQTADYNLVLVLDGVVYRSAVPTPTIVRGLVDAGALGPSVVVAVGNAAGARDAELLHHPGFARHLADEVLPWLRRTYGLAPRPESTVIAGSSLGGLTAAYAAYLYPDRFGAVLAQSGAFNWSDSGRMDGPPTLMREYAEAPLRPTRFFLNAGTFENRVFPGTNASLLANVRHLRDVLEAKGYPVTYSEFEGGHDHAWWAATLGDGLRSLLGSPDRKGPAPPR